MCGIIGYLGKKKTTPLLLNGLKRLEYRGYDSAGIAVIQDSEIKVIRRQGNLSRLEKALDNLTLEGSPGIGHTRWATHGSPSEKNAHPHLDCNGVIAVVHNGIIENFLHLREELKSRGHHFYSDTDTETIAHLIEENYNSNLLEAVRRALDHIEGSYALGVISSREPNCLVAVRKDSPLVLGIAKEGFFIASDIPAFLDQTREAIILENNELVEISSGGYRIVNLQNEQVNRPSIIVKWDIAAAEKGGFEDFMLKEIFEQPLAIRETLRGLTSEGQIVLPDLNLKEESLKNVNKIFIVACGTSLHAGMVAKHALEKWVRLPVEIDCSSEFRYREPVLDSNTLVVTITQSGETADTLACVRVARQEGAKVVSVTNVVGSSVTRESEGVIYTHAGPEIGVAATKTLVSQMIALYILALYLAQLHGTMNEEERKKIIKALHLLPDQASEVLKEADTLKALAEKYSWVNDFLFLGRGIGLAVALEGALKLKEISYIHAEGYPAGEMKHGPIALIDHSVPVVVVALQDGVYEKIVSNIQEAKARGGTIIALATEGDSHIGTYADEVFYIAPTLEILAPVLSVVPLQLLAYYIAKKRGCNVDQPRNLAKSVTVE